MATIAEELARLRFLVSKGRGEEKCHVVLIEEEARKRKENTGPQPKTRFQIETDSPEMYSRFNAQKDRWLRLVPNKSICLDMMCRMWEEPSDEVITAFGAE
jgi:hypothetical protein